MKITIAQNAVSGAVPIPQGDYWVSLQSESCEMKLSAKGVDIRIKAVRRKAANGRSRSTSIQFYSGGGKTWSLLVNDPKAGEWVAFLDYTS